MAESGKELFYEASIKAKKVRDAFIAHPKIMCFNPEEYGLQCDPTKVTFGINGYDANQLDIILKHPKVNIRTEITSINGVVAIINPMMTEDEVSTLISRVTNLADEIGYEKPSNSIQINMYKDILFGRKFVTNINDV